MRRFILLLVLLAPAGNAAAQDPVFAVRAIHEESGLAVANVLIQVRQVETDLVYAEATTNDRGQASIRVAPLQWYAVRAVAPGYFTSRDELLMAPAGGTVSFPVALESLPTRFPMLKYGTISGRVLSPEGQPLPKIIVMAAGRPQDFGGRAVTEKDGSFRMDVPVGAYKISTIDSNPYPEFVTIPPIFDVYGRSEAGPVTVAADRETAGVDIYPPRERRFRARVTVVGAAGPVSEGRVQWRSSNGRGHGATIQPDGVADLGPLASGPIVITAVAGRKPSQMAGTTTIEIVDSPQDEVVVDVFPGGRASGRLVGPDGRPFRLPAGRNWWVIPNAVGSLSTGSGPDYQVERDGRFLVTGLIGEACLIVSGHETHVASITHGGIDYTGRPFSFESGQEISDIVIRLGPGSVAYPDDRRCAR